MKYVERATIVLIAIAFTAALVPLGLFFGVLYGARLGREFYGRLLPHAWRSAR